MLAYAQIHLRFILIYLVGDKGYRNVLDTMGASGLFMYGIESGIVRYYSHFSITRFDFITWLCKLQTAQRMIMSTH